MTRSVLVLAALAVGAASANAQVADRLADLRLATAVRIALVDDRATRPYDLVVTSRDGIVQVDGSVPASAAGEIGRVARAVAGVRSLIGVGADTASGPTVPIRSVSDQAATGTLYHTVEPGDTLFGLARRYDTTLGAILRLNNRTETSIRIGERLRVR